MGWCGKVLIGLGAILSSTICSADMMDDMQMRKDALFRWG